MSFARILAMTDRVTCSTGYTIESAFDVIIATDATLRIGVEAVGEAKQPDLAGRRAWAKSRIAIIRRHGFDRFCFVGRPNPELTISEGDLYEILTREKPCPRPRTLQAAVRSSVT